jgi:hypothetical protein
MEILKITFLVCALLLFKNCKNPVGTEEKTTHTENKLVNSLAPTPTKGWKSWNCFGPEVNEKKIKAVADYMAEQLKEYGWEFVVVDAVWYHPVTFTTLEWNDNLEPPQLIDEFTLELLTNADVLRVIQHSIKNKVLKNVVWTADDKDGKIKYLAVFNISENNREITVDLATLDLSISSVKIVNLWSKRAANYRDNRMVVTLKPHESKLVSISSSETL